MPDVLTTCGRRAAGAALGAILCAAAVEATALAQPPDAPGAPRDDGARAARVYHEGVAAANEGRWQQAYAAYREAWMLKQHFQIAANLGQAALKLGKHRDAAEYLAFFLREAKDISELDRARGQQMLDEARARVATLTLVVNRDRAAVLVDGVPVGTSPLGGAVYVEPGKRKIEARLDGEAPVRTSVTLAAGTSPLVALRFVERPPAPSRREGAQPRRPPAPERGAAGPSKAVLAAGGVATGLALGAAVVLRVAADRREQAGSDAAVPGAASCYSSAPASLDPAQCVEVHGHRSGAVHLHNASTAFFAAAGVAGAATLGYALYGALRVNGTTAVTAAPVALAPGAGISLSTRW
ncbi:hypothetical protein WMF38_48825 [Sorangium sp. So ce118]